MCGIYGTTIAYNSEQIKSKLERVSFRGPDKMDWKFYKDSDRQVCLGHNRLSIIDLDPRSDQPFTYYEFLHISYNGEIYNYKRLRKVLISKGYNFATNSDTEVICAAYLEYGDECVDHFIGMFAFVIYDQRHHLFFGARDRLGKKPFYYYQDGKNFEFASQISSIQLFNKELTISSKAIAFYFAWGNIPDPQSIFNEVKKLRAGYIFKFNTKTGHFFTKPYWDIDYKNEKPFSGTYDEAKTELKTLLNDAVSMRLVADVPVGVFLSGGVDSSLIAAIATQHSSSKVKTFSVKFKEKGFDESVYAQKVADHLQTDHHVIECTYDEGLDMIHSFGQFYDEPFADSSAIPSMLLAKYTSQKVKVALSGDGGDESFLGYHRYRWAKKGGHLYMLPYGMRKIGGKLLAMAPHYRLKVIAKALQLKDRNDAYLRAMTGFDQTYINSVFNVRDVEELKYLKHNHKNFFERISDFDVKTYLNFDINTKVDRATMAFSLEGRAPLLDHRIVDFANALPTDFKYQKNNQKRILKDVLYESVPKAIFDRPKAGFEIPFERWFREDLKEFVMTELSESELKSIPGIDVDTVKYMIDQHMNGTWNRTPLIWKLLVLKQWLNTSGKTYSIQ